MGKNKNFDISIAKEIYNKNKNLLEKNRLDRLKKITRLLMDYFAHKKIKSVYLTGSILKKYRFSEFSDIDIAVEGMNPVNFFEIYGDLEELLETENIDLIELERCTFKDTIINEGYKIK